MKIFLASDHRGFKIKEIIWNILISKKNLLLHDQGPYSAKEAVDYGDYAFKLAAQLSQEDQTARGILICYTGIGMSIAANRHCWIRGALCGDVNDAKLAREHNDANVLIIGAKNFDLAKITDLKALVDAFLFTNFSQIARHSHRIAKISSCRNEQGHISY